MSAPQKWDETLNELKKVWTPLPKGVYTALVDWFLELKDEHALEPEDWAQKEGAELARQGLEPAVRNWNIQRVRDTAYEEVSSLVVQAFIKRSKASEDNLARAREIGIKQSFNLSDLEARATFSLDEECGLSFWLMLFYKDIKVSEKNKNFYYVNSKKRVDFPDTGSKKVIEAWFESGLFSYAEMEGACVFVELLARFDFEDVFDRQMEKGDLRRKNEHNGGTMEKKHRAL